MNSKILLCLLLLFLCNNAITQKNEPTKPFILGEIIEIQSTILNENRTLNIYLPEGYHPDSLTTYPVIYLMDGSADEDFIHIVGLVQFSTFPWLNIIPKSIVVGISNVDRRRDFTFPTTIEDDKKHAPTSGNSIHFINFIEKELQPFIQKKYHTNDTKTIIGQSLGGLLATEILIKKPHLFSNYIIVSPSLWWDDESLLKYPAEFSKPDFQQEISVFVGVGNEDEYQVMENDARALFEVLQKENKKNINAHFQFFEKLDHANVLHLAVYEAFEALFNSNKKTKE